MSDYQVMVLSTGNVTSEVVAYCKKMKASKNGLLK